MAIAYPNIVEIDDDKVDKQPEGRVDELIEAEISEKIDGTQLGFYLENETMVFKNKTTVVTTSTEHCYRVAIPLLSTLKPILNPDYKYYGEIMGNLRQTRIVYKRVVKFGFVGFDICDKSGKYLTRSDREAEFKRLDIEIVHVFVDKTSTPIKHAREIVLQMDEGKIVSMLGGSAEGVVIKYQHLKKGKLTASKFKIVTKKYKEMVKKPGKVLDGKISLEDIVPLIGSWFAVEPRWKKGVNRVQESGKLTGDKEADIRQIRLDLAADLVKERKEFIQLNLWVYFYNYLANAARKSLSDWYLKDIVPPLLSEAETEAETKTVAEFITFVGRKYDTTERFSSAIDKLKDKLEEGRTAKNLSSIAVQLDKMFLELKDEVSLILYNKFIGEVQDNAQKGFSEWFIYVL